MKMSRHSIFPNVVSKTPVSTKDLESIIQEIKKGLYAQPIQELRECTDRSKFDNLKKALPSFTPAGVFQESRKKENLTEYSGTIHLDLDDLTKEKIEHLQHVLKHDLFVQLFYVSPSGKGLKVFMQVASTKEEHSIISEVAQRYFKRRYGVQPDSAVKDLSRLCFVSNDPQAFYRNNCETFLPESVGVCSILLKSDKKATESGEPEEGYRNNWTFAFACECRQLGIDKETCASFSQNMHDLDREEIMRTIESAYAGKNNPAHTVQIDSLKGYAIGRFAPIELFLSRNYELRTNEITNKVEWRPIGKNRNFSVVDEIKFNSILREMVAAGLIKTQTNSLKAVLLSDFVPNYNPFSEYIKKRAPWDGYDYIGELADLLPSKDPEYTKWVFRKWFVAMVASVLNPKIINHTMFVLIGPQGAYKTTWLNYLIPQELKEYVYNGLINPKDKDSLFLMAESCLIIMDELESLKQSEMNGLKELLTRPAIRARRPYGTSIQDFPRAASFAASVNNINFLQDSTGSRRFLCVEVLDMITIGNIELIANCWAQAHALIESGERFWFDQVDTARINVHNEKYELHSFEEEVVRQFLTPSEEDDPLSVFKSASEVIDTLAEYSPNQKMNSVNMGKTLAKLGFKRIKKYNRYGYFVKIISRVSR